jgi:hypothetical protein
MTRTAALSALALLYCADVARADGPKIIASGEWSKAVADRDGYSLRGRLVLCESVVSADRREVAVYVELQDACDFVGHGMQLYCEVSKTDFRPEFKRGLTCELRDKAGKLIEPQGFPIGGGVPRNEWVKLPVDATICLRTTPFGIHRPGALAICPGLGGMWVIHDGDRQEYQLSGTFTIDPPDDQKPPVDAQHVWRGTLELPPAKIVSRKVAGAAG